jgi:hypothetical protein
MISRQEHESIIRRFGATVAFADNGCRDLIWQKDKIPGPQMAQLHAKAREQKKSVEQVMREIIDEQARKDGMEPQAVRDGTEYDLPIEQAISFRKSTRNAHIFEMHTGAFVALGNACRQAALSDYRRTARDMYGEEEGNQVVGVVEDIATDKPVDPIWKERGQSVLNRISEQSSQLVHEENLPFESNLFMVHDPAIAEQLLPNEPVRMRGKNVMCFGLMISKRICYLHLGVDEEAYIDFRPLVLWHRGVWLTTGGTFWSRLVSSLLSVVNDHKQVIEERKKGLADRMFFDRLRKRGQLNMGVPPRFYVVNISDAYIVEHKKTLVPRLPIQWNHRWDVRGHSVLRFRRGLLGTLLPDERADLLDRGYKIFEQGQQTDAVTTVEMERRRLKPKRDDEWLAVLLTWRDDFVKGPADKPYVPSVHRIPEEGT